MSKYHVEHVLDHLDRVDRAMTATPDPEAVYLGSEDGSGFWELVGLRLKACPITVLAAVRFNRHELPGITHARESLASLLSSPPPAGPWGEPGTLAVRLPKADERIPSFLRSLRAGKDVPVVALDPARIEAAFDFRMHNPSGLVSLKEAAGPLRRYLLRTANGHVLRGETHEMRVRENGESRFVALRTPQQLTPMGVRSLPTMILNRSYLSLTIDISEEVAGLVGSKWVPFRGATASRESLIPLPAVD